MEIEAPKKPQNERNELLAELRACKEKLIVSRKERDELTSKVKQLKLEKLPLEEEIKKIPRFDEIPRASLGVISQLKKRIQLLETKVETEGMPYEKEKEVTKEIKDLIKNLKEQQALLDDMRKKSESGQKYRELRQKIKAAVIAIRKEANASQIHHESMVKESRRIKEILTRLKELDKERPRDKPRFNKPKRHEFKKEFPKAQSEEHKQLQKMRAEVEEKIKTGKTLTIKDLMTYQDSEENKNRN